ncbi:MAG: hypothetical protein K0R31_1503 [Clostridiales bacterium]|jgi:hypothetical protein|nr:hypothetical protein [Clostridiales bacterium]
MIDFKNNDTQCIIRNSVSQAAAMPYALYLSLQGKYFVGFAADVQFSNRKYGWAGLVNPSHSCVNLHVYVWTVTNFGIYPLNAEIWFNTTTPEDTVTSEYITPANTAICPLPRPKVRILQANNVSGAPPCGDKIFVRKVLPEVTIVGEEDGRFIFPPGGSFSVLLSNAEASNQSGIANVAFGWYEEAIR